MRARRRLWSCPLAVALLCAAGGARATIVERVVAVVGEQPILWTELVHRAVAGRIQIRMQTRDPNVIDVQEQELYKDLLDRMIDDRLEEEQAAKAHISVTPQEVDRGIQNIAEQARAQQSRAVSVNDLLDEVRQRGMSEQDFRDEIRRQIIEGKLIELRVRSRVRVTDQDARAAYRRWAQDMTEQQPREIRVLALRVPAGATKEQEAARLALGNELALRARHGEDFCRLVADFSDDTQTRDTCGSRGAQPLSTLLPPIQKVVRTLASGSVSDPILVSAGQDDAVVLVMPMGQESIPPFDKVKNEMMTRALAEGLDRARKEWLAELRRDVYVDVRL